MEGCSKCGTPQTLEEFLKKLFYKDSNGNVGIYAKLLTPTNCDQIEPVANCGSINDLGEMIQSCCGEDECGNPYINIISTPNAN